MTTATRILIGNESIEVKNYSGEILPALAGDDWHDSAYEVFAHDSYNGVMGYLKVYRWKISTDKWFYVGVREDAAESAEISADEIDEYLVNAWSYDEDDDEWLLGWNV